MSQQPTEGKATEIIKEYKGLNDQSDSVKRPPGTVTDARNFLDEQSGDASRRYGRIFSSLDDGNPIGLIYNLTWDDGSSSMIDFTGSTFSFNNFTFPFDATVGSLLTSPCPDGVPTTCPPGSTLTANADSGNDFCADNTTGDPICPPPPPTGPIYLIPNKSLKPIPDFVPLIRALAECYYFAKLGITSLTIPTQSIGVDFYDHEKIPRRVASDVSDKNAFSSNYNRGFTFRRSASHTPRTPPPDLTFLPLDFYYVDYVVQGELRYVQDLNLIIKNYNTIVLVEYLKTNPDLNPQTLSNYAGTDYFAGVAFPSNYREVCAQFAGVLNAKLLRVKKTATQSSLLTKTGTAQDAAGSCILTDLCISGYSDGFFSGGSAAGCDGCPGGDIWDGRMIFNGTIGPTTCQYGLDPLSENCTIMNNKDINRVTLRYDPTGVGLSGFSIEPSGGFLCTCNYLWAGEKTTGLNSPYGVYTISEGCYTSPTTLTIVAC